MATSAAMSPMTTGGSVERKSAAAMIVLWSSYASLPRRFMASPRRRLPHARPRGQLQIVRAGQCTGRHFRVNVGGILPEKSRAHRANDALAAGCPRAKGMQIAETEDGVVSQHYRAAEVVGGLVFTIKADGHRTGRSKSSRPSMPRQRRPGGRRSRQRAASFRNV